MYKKEGLERILDQLRKEGKKESLRYWHINKKLKLLNERDHWHDRKNNE